MNRMLKLALLAVVLAPLTSIYAQEQNVEKVFRAFVEEVNNLDDTKDVNLVLTFLDDNFTSERTIAGPMGTMFTETESLEQFQEGLEELTVDRDISSELKIESLEVEMNGENAARVKTSVKVTIDVDGKLGERAAIDATFLMAQKSGEWKMMRAQISRSVAQRNVGECFFKLNRRDSDYVSEVFYPTGFEYIVNNDIVQVLNEGNERFISINYQEYPWNEDGTVVSLIDDQNVELGTADKQEDAIILVLSKKYENTCLRLVKR
ncbi:MAG: hypothetical protein RIC80_15535 [Cyclobacteriaceae bacterium]